MTEKDNRPKKYIICDLDGTLCDHAHRAHHIETKDWDRYHGALYLDEPHWDVLQMLRCFQESGYRTIALTGRNQKWQSQTYEWFLKHGIHFDELIMRPDHDFTSDHELKPQQLTHRFNTLEEALESTLLILEDRDKVVEAWRNLGFRCWQVQPGGY